MRVVSSDDPVWEGQGASRTLRTELYGFVLTVTTQRRRQPVYRVKLFGADGADGAVVARRDWQDKGVALRWAEGQTHRLYRKAGDGS